MSTQEQILEKLKNAKTSLKRRYSVKDIALFGDYSTGEATKDSMVDLLITFDKAPGLRFMDMETELETLLDKKVNVMMRKGIDSSYYKSIRKELIKV